jgi:hypothetical protein
VPLGCTSVLSVEVYGCGALSADRGRGERLHYLGRSGVVTQIEQTWTPDEANAFALEYERSGTASADVTAKIRAIVKSCVGSA